MKNCHLALKSLSINTPRSLIISHRNQLIRPSDTNEIRDNFHITDKYDEFSENKIKCHFRNPIEQKIHSNNDNG